MRAIGLALLAALAMIGFVTDGIAQTTNCSVVGTQLICRPAGGLTDPYANSGGWSEFNRAQQAQGAQAQAQAAALVAARARAVAEQQAAAAKAQADNAAQQRQFRAQNAGQLVAAGKCDEARAYALSEGDFPLADQVAHACSLAPVAPRQ